MYPHNHGNAYATPQGYTPNPAYGPAPMYASNPLYAPASGNTTTSPPVPAPVFAPVPAPIPAPLPVQMTVPVPVPSPSVLSPVQVPPGHYPIELVQFWRNEHKRGQPFPLHWALFVRTAPCRSPSPTPSIGAHGRGSGHPRPRRVTAIKGTSLVPRGNFYEVVGSSDTYTAQFLPSVTFEPDALADWRGAHVIGWVNPVQLALFERVVRQVPVWRHRPDWRSQHWVYEVVRAVGGNYQGVFTDAVSFGGLQRHMGKLLDAWENGDI